MTSGLLNPIQADFAKKEIDSRRARLVDLRHGTDYISENIPNSIHGILDQHAYRLLWLSSLIPKSKCIILLTNPGDEDRAYKALAENSYTQIRGYLDGGLEAWKKAGYETAGLDACQPESLKKLDFNEEGNNVLLDVRESYEWNDKGVHPNAQLYVFLFSKTKKN